MAGGVYPGGVSRKELEQRFRQLQNQMRTLTKDEVRAYIRSTRSSGGSSVGSFSPSSTGDGVTTHEFTHSTASDTWIVNHNLGRYPMAHVIDSAGTEVFGKVTHVSKNRLRIEFSAAFKGKALLV